LPLHYNRKVKWSIVIIAVTAIMVVYINYNPSESQRFPKCPFLQITGFKCPGCGSQRAIHNLLNLEISKAFHFNSILVLSIPYVLFGLILDNLKELSPKMMKWRKILYGKTSIIVVLIIILLFWLLRNVFDF
jgi:hypothetical protein